MSAALAAAGARVGHVGACRRRYWHPYFGAGYRIVLSDFAVAAPALDWRTLPHHEYRVARRFARVHLYRWSKSPLRLGELPAGAQFGRDLAGPALSNEVADHFSGAYLPAVRPLSLL